MKTSVLSPLIATLLAAIALSVQPSAQGSIVINVALGNRDSYPMTGTASNDAFQSATPGTAAPLTYLGSTWNQAGGAAASASGLLDSQGTATLVGFAVNGYKDAVGDHGGAGILQFLGAGVHADGPATTGGFHPEPGTLPSLTLTGLNDGWTYRLAIISGGNYDNINQWNIGGTATFADPETPTGFVGGTTLTTSSDTAQRSTWVDGVNYVTFSGLIPVGGTLTVQNIALVDKFSMNGFQLEASTAVPEPGTWAAAALLVVGVAFVRLRVAKGLDRRPSSSS